MVVVRNVFKVKFGKMKEAVALMKENMVIAKRAGMNEPYRILTDVVGDFYTLVLEISSPNMSGIESTQGQIMGNKEWQANYQKFTPLVDSGYREILNVVE